MSRGWILDTGAVFEPKDRALIIGLLPAVLRKGLRIVVPEHILLELSRQEMVRIELLRRVHPTMPRPTAPAVVAGLSAQLGGVTFETFERTDAEALLDWIGTPGADEWEETKLLKAVSEGWLPIRDAFLALPCPVCSWSLSECSCRAPVWAKEDKGVLLQDARARCAAGRRSKNMRASSTIDWLTVGMALGRDLQIVTREKNGPEWKATNRIFPADLAAEVAAQPG